MNSQTQIFSIYHGLRLAAIPLVLLTLVSMSKGATAQEAATDSSSSLFFICLHDGVDEQHSRCFSQFNTSAAGFYAGARCGREG